MFAFPTEEDILTPRQMNYLKISIVYYFPSFNLAIRESKLQSKFIH